jgi:beta-glucosidase
VKQTATGDIRITADIQNTGPRAGTEVVQLYIRDLVSSVTTYEKNLRGFARVSLAPGERKTIAFVLKPEHLALWDRNMRFVVDTRHVPRAGRLVV